VCKAAEQLIVVSLALALLHPLMRAVVMLVVESSRKVQLEDDQATVVIVEANFPVGKTRYHWCCYE
jgi:hypothetical protein